MTKSKMNNTSKPEETIPINNQFSVFASKYLAGIKLNKDQSPVASNGVYAKMHFSLREFNIISEPVDEVTSLKNFSDSLGSILLYDL